jgi:hypothetical protein
MSDSAILMPVIGGLISVLIMIIGWSANQINTRLTDINETLNSIERDLRKELSAIDSRLSVVESKVSK